MVNRIPIPAGALPHIANLSELRDHLQRMNLDIRFVGGCVRGWLRQMPEEPKDIDLHTNARPEVIMALCSFMDCSVYTTGLQHGTVTAVLNGVSYEITTLRRDVATDGRHATVEFTHDWEADLARRDLSINAMSLSFDGDLMDPHKGRSDLFVGLVRFVGEPFDRIREDYLRILRFFRFLGRYANDTVDGSLILGHHQAYCLGYLAEGLKQVSRERILVELLGILKGDRADQVIELMNDHGISSAIGLPKGGTDLLKIAMRTTDDPYIRLAAYMDRMSKFGEEHAFIPSLPLPNYERKLIAFLVNQRYVRKLTIEDYKRRIFVDNVPHASLYALAQMLGQDEESDQLEDWVVPKLPINGHDIRPLVRDFQDYTMILGFVRQKYFEANFTLTKDECLAWAEECAKVNA